MADIADYSIVPAEPVLTGDLYGRLLPPYAEQKTAGIPGGKILLFDFLWNAWDNLCGKKKEKKKAKPPPEPGEGGTMKYHSRLFPGHWFPKTGKVVYEYLKNMAENDGYQVRELSYNDLQNEYPTSIIIQGYERPGMGGHKIGVMKYDTDGSKVSNWKMARILAHEYIGARFTRKGLSHEANHSKIESESDALLRELASA